MIAPSTKRLGVWLVSACVASPILAAAVLAGDKAYRIARAGYRVGNEPIAVAAFGAAELLIVAVVITLPAVSLCVAASVSPLRVLSPSRLVALGAFIVVVFSSIYSRTWGSLEWPVAAAWGFTFFAWPLLLRSVRPKRAVV